MDRKNSVLATMFIPEPGLPSIKLENNINVIFSELSLVLGAFNVVRHYQASEQWCYFEELTDFIR